MKFDLTKGEFGITLIIHLNQNVI